MLQNHSRLPLYLQIKEDLIDKIKAENYNTDEKIPSENELTDIYNVSQITVRKALKDLVNDGYLYRVQGKGTFVAKRKINRMLNLMSFTEEMRSKGLQCTSKVLDVKLIKDKIIARELEILPTKSIIKAERLRLIDEDPVALQTSYIPESVVSLEQIKELYEEHSLYRVLKREDINPHKAHEKYNATVLNKDRFCTLLEMEKGEPVFSVKRYTYTEDNTLFEYAESILKGDVYTMEVVLNN